MKRSPNPLLQIQVFIMIVLVISNFNSSLCVHRFNPFLLLQSHVFLQSMVLQLRILESYHAIQISIITAFTIQHYTISLHVILVYFHFVLLITGFIQFLFVAFSNDIDTKKKYAIPRNNMCNQIS